MNYKINQIKNKDLNTIVNIWMKSLPSDFFVILGSNFILKIYFKTFFNLKKKIGFKIIYKKRIVGFVLYGRFDQLINKIIKEDFTNLIFHSFKSILVNYKALVLITNVIIFKFLTTHLKYLNNNNTEMLTLAIHPKYQGKKLGSILVMKSISILKNKKFAKKVCLKTRLKSTKFYQKCKFKVFKKVFGRSFLVRVL